MRIALPLITFIFTCACAGDVVSAPGIMYQPEDVMMVGSSPGDESLRFSEAELRDAFQKGGLEPSDVEALVGLILEVQQEGDGFILTDETLLMIAAVSDDAARRVLRFNPSLAEMVAELRKNPGSLLELLAELRRGGL